MYQKQETLNLIESTGLIVIVRGAEADTLIPLAESLSEGGIRLMEITYDMSGKTDDSAIAAGIETLSKRFGDRMLIGAGTVMNERQVELTEAAGGRFILSPDFDPAVVESTLRRGLVSIPGVFTPTEAAAAHKLGADFVKLFPVNTVGADYIRMLKAPLSAVKFIAVGNIDINTAPEYIAAGAAAVSVGGAVARRDLIDAGDYAALAKNAAAFTDVIRKAKGLC